VAEGKADTPVGTMLAALEQTSKMISAVHRRSHTAQALEFQTLLEHIRERPEDFIKYFVRDGFWSVERLKKALDNWSLIPRADPNTPTQMHRLLKMMALKQLQQLAPDLYDEKKVDTIILRTLGFEDPEEFFAPPAPPGQMPPDPSLAIATIVAQTEAGKNTSREKIAMGQGQLKVLEFQGKQQTEAQNLAAQVELQRQKDEAAAELQRQKDDAAAERELLKIGAAMETGDADREHQSSESEATRTQAEKIARMKPAPGKPKK